MLFQQLSPGVSLQKVSVESHLMETFTDLSQLQRYHRTLLPQGQLFRRLGCENDTIHTADQSHGNMLADYFIDRSRTDVS